MTGLVARRPPPGDAVVEPRAGSLADALERLGVRRLRPGQDRAIAAASGGARRPGGDGHRLGQVALLPGAGGRAARAHSGRVAADRAHDRPARRARSRGIPAAALHSGLSDEEQRAALTRARAGELSLLYVAPERFHSSVFRRAMAEARVALLVIDEAHCVSEWGHEFRPDYRRVGQFRGSCGHGRRWPSRATATERVRADIVRRLGLEAPVEVVGGFDRPNLTFDALWVEGKGSVARKRGAMLAALEAAGGGKAIVYCGTRRAAEETAAPSPPPATRRSSTTPAAPTAPRPRRPSRADGPRWWPPPRVRHGGQRAGCAPGGAHRPARLPRAALPGGRPRGARRRGLPPPDRGRAGRRGGHPAAHHQRPHRHGRGGAAPRAPVLAGGRERRLPARPRRGRRRDRLPPGHGRADRRPPGGGAPAGGRGAGGSRCRACRPTSARTCPGRSRPELRRRYRSLDQAVAYVRGEGCRRRVFLSHFDDPAEPAPEERCCNACAAPGRPGGGRRRPGVDARAAAASEPAAPSAWTSAASSTRCGRGAARWRRSSAGRPSGWRPTASRASRRPRRATATPSRACAGVGPG